VLCQAWRDDGQSCKERGGEACAKGFLFFWEKPITPLKFYGKGGGFQVNGEEGGKGE